MPSSPQGVRVAVLILMYGSYENSRPVSTKLLFLKSLFANKRLQTRNAIRCRSLQWRGGGGGDGGQSDLLTQS
jgi:hypothetical protein